MPTASQTYTVPMTYSPFGSRDQGGGDLAVINSTPQVGDANFYVSEC